MKRLIQQLTDRVISSDLVIASFDDSVQIQQLVSGWTKDCIVDILRGYPTDCSRLATVIDQTFFVQDVDQLQSQLKAVVDIPDLQL